MAVAKISDPNVEAELKLTASAETIEALSRSEVVARMAQGRGVVRNLESAYYDTPDLRLSGRGIALRVRGDGERFVQTVKMEAESGGALVRRGEWEAPVADSRPDLAAIGDAEARERLGLILPGELRPVFTNRVRREVRLIDGPDDSGRDRAIEIAVDVGETRAGGAAEPISEIELELLRGSAENVFDLALALHRIGHVRVEHRTKAERGYALSTGASPRWRKARPVVFGPRTTIDEALARVLAACFRHWTANEPAALDGRDPEGVHQMRVGLRRLRSALSVFGPLLPADALEWLEREAGSALGALGRARDLDVFLDELLDPVIGEFPDEECLAALRRAAERKRAEGYEQARSAIGSPRYTEFVLRFGGWMEGRRWRTGDTAGALDRPLAAYADELLEKRHRKTLRLGRRFETLTAERRHRVRIALKKLRYAVGFFESLHPGRETGRYAKSLSRLQDGLGHLNDVSVARRLVEDLANRGAPSGDRVALQRAAGLLIGWCARGVVDTEPELVASWEAFRAAAPFWRRQAVRVAVRSPGKR